MSQENDSLAAVFGVDYDAAADVMEKESQDCFFDELAKHGFVPRNEREAIQLIELAQLIENKEAQARDSQPSLIGVAHDHLAKQAGYTGGDFQQRKQAEWEQEFHKASQDALDPALAAHAMVLVEGRNLLIQQAAGQ